MTLYYICYVYPQKPVSFRYVAWMNAVLCIAARKPG